jgi:hypothetical protein
VSATPSPYSGANLTKYQFEVDPKKLRVDIGMPVHTGFIPYPTAAALMDTVREMTMKCLVVRHISPVGSSIVTDARSAVVNQFLKGDGTHLFWIDSDMHWHPRDFMKLVAYCTQVDVVGATYTQKVEPPRFMMREPKNTPNQYGFLEVAGLGLGFACMKREVVEKVAASKRMIRTNGGEMREVFTFGLTEDGHRMGEDMRFFQDIREAGYTVWCDPKVNIRHVGIKLYGGDAEAALGAK